MNNQNSSENERAFTDHIYQNETIRSLCRYPDTSVMIPVYGHTKKFGADTFFNVLFHL